MEIITKFTSDLDDKVYLDEVTITYIQNPDCTENNDAEYQRLTISTRDNGIDKFLNIKTNNWSIGNTSNLVEVIEDFKKRIGYE